MSGDSSAEKTEKASPKKIREAKKKGNLVKSKDIAGTVVMIGVVVYLLFALGGIFDDLNELYDQVFIAIPNHSEGVYPLIVLTAAKAGKIVISLLSVAAICGIIATATQVGFNPSTEPIKPSLKRVNPVEGFKKLFQWRKVFEVAKSVFLLIAILYATYYIFKLRLPDIVQLPSSGLSGVLVITNDVFKKLLSVILPILLVIAAVDYAFQRHVWYQDLRMTKDDVKRERKDQDGDPETNAKRKQEASTLREGDNSEMLHYANLILNDGKGKLVAIYYNPQYAALPVMLLKAQGSKGDEMLNSALKLGIRIVQDELLANIIYRRGRNNDTIPEEIAVDVIQCLK